MIDLLLLAEIAWITITLSTVNLQRLLIYIGGLLSANYVAFGLSAWLMKSFALSGNHAFLWLTNQMDTSTAYVGIVTTVIPAESVAIGSIPHARWIAEHVLHALLFVGITCSIFILFLIVGSVADAVWDIQIHNLHSRVQRRFAGFLSAICALIVAGQTGYALANLAWLKSFSIIKVDMNQSILLSLLNMLLIHAHFLSSVFS